eukprot:jgi/Psemu1/288074/fgenesh1_pg.234_\
MLLGENAFVPLGSSTSPASYTKPSSFRSDGEAFRREPIIDGSSSSGCDRDRNRNRVLGFRFELHSTRHRHDSAASEEQQQQQQQQQRTTRSGSGDEFESSKHQHRYSGSSSTSRFFPAPGLTWKNSPLSRDAKSGGGGGGDNHGDVSFFASAPGFSAPTKQRNGGVRLLRFPSSPLLPAWFPWIPTKSQIGSLKVKELREACTQRGLAKSGNKAVLQERLWEWTTDHQIQHQARLSGDYLTNWFEEDSDTNDPNAFLSERRKQDTEQQLSGETPSNNSKMNSNMNSKMNSEKDELIGKRQQYEFTEDVMTPTETETETEKRQTINGGSSTPNSLAEWSRSVDTEIPEATKEYLKEYLRKLTNAMKLSPSSPDAPNNRDAMELYGASKKADQLGETDLAIQLLESLLEMTPKDARLYRRLSRMHNDKGNPNVARATLQKGLRLLPDNPWLWHGMGQLELYHGRTDYAVRCFQRAIQEDPAFAHSYHAWGVHEFSNGQIAKAMKILKKGIEYCPTNHRLHHALGDLYRGAKLLKDAERCYKRALEEGPPVSHGFALSALACVAYEQGDVDEARAWLYRSIETNNGRHAQGWLALAQLEEAEGNTEQALTVCEASIIRYEKELVDAHKRYKSGSKRVMKHLKNPNRFQRGTQSGTQSDGSPININPTKFDDDSDSDSETVLLESIPKYRSGDKFFGVFRHWARLEGRYGTYDGANRVYERASSAFPWNYKISLDWAIYNAKLQNVGRARTLFGEACSRASTHNAEPYREYASFEISLGEYEQARKILFRGAQAVTRSSNGGLGSASRQGLAQLYVTWAVCEWHLGNIPRVEVLFDHALRLTEIGSKQGSELRSFILFCIAQLEYYERDELYLAQHCIGLCLKENSFPGGNAPIWKLWARVSRDMGNSHMEDECWNEAQRCGMLPNEEESKEEGGTTASAIDTMNMLKGSQNLKNFMRQQPWHDKLQAVRGADDSSSSTSSSSSLQDFYSSIRIPRTRNHSKGRNDHRSHRDQTVQNASEESVSTEMRSEKAKQ